MKGLTSLEVYNSLFNITEEKNKFELYKFTDSKSGGTSYGKVIDEIGKDSKISGITGTDFPDEYIGSLIIEEYRKEVSKRMKSDKYMNFLARYTSSKFQDFESFLRTEVDLVEDE